jgi:hypothetical protein
MIKIMIIKQIVILSYSEDIEEAGRRIEEIIAQAREGGREGIG